LVGFYKVWHGSLRLPGAGFVIRRLSQRLRGLQNFPLEVKGIGTVGVDFRDYSGFLWMQHLLGDTLAAHDIETGLFRALEGRLRKGMVFWDIGANAGTVAAYVTAKCPGVTIIAFEPNPSIFQGLRLLFNNSRSVRVFPYALSDADGKVVLTVPKGKSTGGSVVGMDYVLSTSNLRPEDVEQATVEAYKGDSLLRLQPDVPAPDVIKIDVEGHEAAVIAGLARLIKEKRPILIFEHLYLTDEAVTGLIPPGYSIHSIDNDTGEFAAGFERKIGHNSALVPAL
jgi:FkbM family methyltransferase